MSESKYCVYKHTSPSGKAYVGQTKDYKTRCTQHKNHNTKCILFFNAIKKYGWDNFSHEILKDNLTLEQANQWESEIIEKHNTLSPNGYNLKVGGDNARHSNLTKEKIKLAMANPVTKLLKSNAMKAIHANKEYQEKMKAIHSTKEYKEKLSSSLKLSHSKDSVKEKCALSRSKEGHKESHSKAVKEGMATKESKEKRSKIAKELWENEEYRRKWKESSNKTYKTEEYIKKQSDLMKKISRNPENQKKRIATLNANKEIKKQAEFNLIEKIQMSLF